MRLRPAGWPQPHPVQGSHTGGPADGGAGGAVSPNLPSGGEALLWAMAAVLALVLVVRIVRALLGRYALLLVGAAVALWLLSEASRAT